MRPYDRSLRLSVAIGALLAILPATSGFCEEGPPPVVAYRSPPAYFWPQWGPGTAYSAAMHGNADFFRAVGALRVDTAVARSIHADAYAKELNNSKLAVQIYFERRLMNQAYRRMLDPSWGRKRPQIVSPGQALFEKVRKGDLYKEMNWLLLALFQKRMYNDAAFNEAVSQDAVSDLDQATLEHLWFTDRPERGIRFQADAIPMNEEWPALLQTPVFEEARREFAKARDDALEHNKKNGSKDASRNKRLQRACDKLNKQFRDEYASKLSGPEKVGGDDWIAARVFLNSLMYQVERFAKTDFQQDANHFQGDRIGELVDFMGSRGLYFAKPQAGDEGAYQAVFIKMQGMYERLLHDDRAAAK
jgi:hypothetical protein